jgi:tRNA 2-thiouridine synthesizing protein A
MTLTDDDTETEDADSLPLRELVRLVGGRCQDCQTSYTAGEAVWSIALGFKNAPRCLPCLCRRLDRPEADLTASLTDYVQRRECYLRAWNEAIKMDEHTVILASRERERPENQETPVSDTPGSPETHWDAGDLGCGDLVMQLRIRLKKLAPGNVIHVTATDPAAPEDIPAWCRMTGQTLLCVNHPNYSIRRKED